MPMGSGRLFNLPVDSLALRLLPAGTDGNERLIWYELV